MQPVLSPIARISSTSLSLRRCSAGRRASSDRFSLDRPRPLSQFLDQSRDDALDRGVGEVPLAGELHRGEAGVLSDRPQAVELRAALGDPALGTK